MNLFSAEPASRELLLAALLIPYLLLLLLGPHRTRPLSIALAPWAALPALFAAALLPSKAGFNINGLLTGISLGIDETGRLFLFFTALLWWLGGWYARGWFTDISGKTRFTGFYLATMAGNLGLTLAQDLLGFYLFFTFMNFTAYGLVVHQGTPPARYAGRIYITFLLLGEACLFTAIASTTLEVESLAWIDLHASRMDALSISLFLIGFGVKLGVLGLHAWLPPTYSAAPTPAGALLSGAVIKASLLGWMRILPWGESGWELGGQILIFLGLGAAFYGSVVGILQTHPKTALAYSSISQMGLITLLVGIGLAFPDTVPAVTYSILLFALHHALTKAALFLGVGIIGVSQPQAKYFAWAGLIWLALALAGIPGSSGALAKGGLTQATILGGLHQQLGSFLSLASITTTLLMARFLYLLRGYQAEVTPPHPSLLWLPWMGLLVILSIVPGQWLYRQVTIIGAGIPESLWSSLWPIALGTLIAGLALYHGFRKNKEVSLRSPSCQQQAAKIWKSRRLRGSLSWLRRLEQLLHHWNMVGRALILLAVVLTVALWWGDPALPLRKSATAASSQQLILLEGPYPDSKQRATGRKDRR